MASEAGNARKMKPEQNEKEVEGSPLARRFQVVGLTLAAVYVPYLLLFLAEATTGNVKAVLGVWPVFPGLALSQLVPPYGFLNQFRGLGGTLLFTLLFVTLSLVIVSRFRRSIWLPLSGVVLASSGLVYVMLLLLRA